MIHFLLKNVSTRRSLRLFDLYNIKLSSLVAYFCHTKGSSEENEVIPLSESHDQVDAGNLSWTALYIPVFVLVQCAILFCIFVSL